MPQDGSEDAPRGLKIAPRPFQEAKKLPKEAPKRPKSFKNHKKINVFGLLAFSPQVWNGLLTAMSVFFRMPKGHAIMVAIPVFPPLVRCFKVVLTIGPLGSERRAPVFQSVCVYHNRGKYGATSTAVLVILRLSCPTDWPAPGAWLEAEMGVDGWVCGLMGEKQMG